MMPGALPRPCERNGSRHTNLPERCISPPSVEEEGIFNRQWQLIRTGERRKGHREGEKDRRRIKEVKERVSESTQGRKGDGGQELNIKDEEAVNGN